MWVTLQVGLNKCENSHSEFWLALYIIIEYFAKPIVVMKIDSVVNISSEYNLFQCSNAAEDVDFVTKVMHE